MATPIIQVTVTRLALGLTALNINDHVKFITSADIFGGSVSWRRQVVQSPYVESQFTVNRVRDIVEDKFAVDVIGANQVVMQNNLAELIDAFSQDYFNVTVQLDAAYYTYACEASDYTVDFTQSRMFALFGQVKFNLRRSPVAINGV